MKIKGKLIFLKGTNETKKCSEKKNIINFPSKSTHSLLALLLALL